MDRHQLERLAQRRDRIAAWLEDEAPYARADQTHQRANTPERSYWHYGYMIALQDVLRLLQAEPTDTKDKSP
jgi:hypothetical protein